MVPFIFIVRILDKKKFTIHNSELRLLFIGTIMFRILPFITAKISNHNYEL